MVYVKHNTWDYSGLSTDEKPVNVNIPDLASFWEFDTKTAYIYSVKNINPATGNGWWAVWHYMKY